MTSLNIDLKTYKTLTSQEFLKGDEKFDSIITNFDEELFYDAPVEPKKKLPPKMKR